jgi:hypothetical protein
MLTDREKEIIAIIKSKHEQAFDKERAIMEAMQKQCGHGLATVAMMGNLCDIIEKLEQKNEPNIGLTDTEQKVIKTIRGDYYFHANRVSVVTEVINESAGCRIGTIEMIKYLFEIILKLSNEVRRLKQKNPELDDFMGLDDSDEDTVYIKRVRMKARDIIESLEPHHINHTQTLIDKLEHALEETKLLQRIHSHIS